MVEFIADVGTSWMGDFDLLDYMVGRLKKMGATAFKPQVWDPSIYAGHDLEGEALKSHIDNNAIKKIEEISERRGLEVFYSVFDENCLKRVILNTEAKRVKFAHSMRYKGDLISKAVLEDKFEQVIVSVDGWEDYFHRVYPGISDVVKDPGWPNFGRDKVKLLYCVPNYPTSFEDIHFKNKFPVLLDGFSDHTTGILAPVVAVALGADMLEKHVRCNKNDYMHYLGKMPRFPDEVCAITLDKFSLMLGECRIAEEMTK